MKKINAKNKKKIITIASIVGGILLIIGLVVAFIIKTDKANDKKSKEKTVAKADPEKAAKDMLYNNYLISYILEGDVQIGEGTLRIEDTGEIYYAVTDPLLEDIHSIGDIIKLINNNVNEEPAVRAMKLMESQYANQYTYNENTLYVKKTASPCVILEDGPIEKDKATYKLNEGNTYIVYKNVPYQGYYDSENKLKANTLWFACSKNFANTKTGKEDVYDPVYVEPIDENENQNTDENKDTPNEGENGEN